MNSWSRSAVSTTARFIAPVMSAHGGSKLGSTPSALLARFGAERAKMMGQSKLPVESEPSTALPADGTLTPPIPLLGALIISLIC